VAGDRAVWQLDFARDRSVRGTSRSREQGNLVATMAGIILEGFAHCR
jgi:hypothetical protein